MNETPLLWWSAFGLWAAVGGADYLCHRASRIEATPFGAPESRLHALQWAQVVVGVVALLVFAPTAPVVAVAAATAIAHTATAVWDIRLATPHRVITPLEDAIHAVLIGLPLLAVVVAALQSDAPLDAGLRLRDPAVPPHAALGVAAVFVVSGLFIAEEHRRCRRAQRREG